MTERRSEPGWTPDGPAEPYVVVNVDDDDDDVRYHEHTRAYDLSGGGGADEDDGEDVANLQYGYTVYDLPGVGFGDYGDDVDYEGESSLAALIAQSEKTYGPTHPRYSGSDPTAVYYYLDEVGVTLYIVCRYQLAKGKTFRQYRPNDDGGWIANLDGVRRVLYRLPEVLAHLQANTHEPLYIVEGEKDVHAVENAGGIATTCPMGAGKWTDDYSELLQGARLVVIVADCDDIGRKHAATVRASLAQVGVTAEIVQAATGKDAADHLDDPGQSLATFVPLVLHEVPTLGQGKRKYNPTDLGNAERLIASHGQDLHYVYPWSRWLVWTGSRWESDESGEAERRLKDTLRQLFVDASEINSDDERKALVRHVLASEKAGSIRGALELARSEPGVPIKPDQLDANPMILNVLNGKIDLTTGAWNVRQLRPHDRGDLISKLAPVTFDLAATAPRWLAFLETILPDPEVRAFVQRFAGYCLTGSTVEQVLAIFWGRGANGKSTFIEALRFVLGDYGQQAPAETFTERRGDSIPNDVARIRGARLVAATELAENRRLNEALVKRMTGGDTMVARFMRAEFFEFEMLAKVIIATNHKPEIRGTDEAIWRRIRLVPFTVTIPEAERDHQLAETLRAEAAGILNWCVTGCLAWQEHGLGAPEAVMTATSDYRADQDVLGQFLDDCCTIDGNAVTKAGELLNAYGYWRMENGGDELTAKEFGLRLADRGFVSGRTNTGRTWKGVAITRISVSDA